MKCTIGNMMIGTLKDGESQRESDNIAPGSEVVATDVRGVRTGLSICYDLRFPLLYQRLVDEGARIITVPAAFTEFTGKDHWLVLLRARGLSLADAKSVLKAREG